MLSTCIFFVVLSSINIALLDANPADNPCPRNWIHFDSRCFFVKQEKVTYWDAVSSCKTLKARLPQTLNRNEILSVQYLMNKKGFGHDFWLEQNWSDDPKNAPCNLLPNYVDVREANCKDGYSTVCVTEIEQEVNACPESKDGRKWIFEEGKCWSYFTQADYGRHLEQARTFCQTHYGGDLPLPYMFEDTKFLASILTRFGVTSYVSAWIRRKEVEHYYGQVFWHCYYATAPIPGIGHKPCENTFSFICEVPPKAGKTVSVKELCPEPSLGGQWAFNDGKCYFITRHNDFTSSEAVDFCKNNFNSTLPIFKDPREKKFLTSLVEKIGYPVAYDFWLNSDLKEELCNVLPTPHFPDKIDCETPNSLICVSESEKVKKASCPDSWSGRDFLLENGKCFAYFTGENDTLPWKEAGKFCRETCKGFLPFARTKDDEDHLASVFRRLGGLGGWIGGKDGDKCNGLSSTTFRKEPWVCGNAHSFLCAVWAKLPPFSAKKTCMSEIHVPN